MEGFDPGAGPTAFRPRAPALNETPDKEIRIMSRNVRQLASCLFVLAALAMFSAPAARAFDLSYTRSGVGGTMAQACNNAIQSIKDDCDVYGPITTNPIHCLPLYGPGGVYLGKVCTCEATTTSCANYAPFPGTLIQGPK